MLPETPDNYSGIVYGAERIASIGSPSSNSYIILDLNETGKTAPLVGALVAVRNELADREEFALGTVIEITTRNPWHENASYRSSFKGEELPLLSGESDYYIAKVALQAAWHRTHGETVWIPAGPSLRMSPATGGGVYLVGRNIVTQLTETTDNLHAIGWLGGAQGTPLPLSIPDFRSALGAFHTGVFGQSGSGKALDVNTPIPTPHGFTPIGELRAGDWVYDENGAPCRILEAHPVLHNRDCYKIIFSNFDSVVADADHLWVTHALQPEVGKPAETVRTTRELLGSLHTDEGYVNHSLPARKALEGADNPAGDALVGKAYKVGYRHGGKYRISADEAQPFLRADLHVRLSFLYGLLAYPYPTNPRTALPSTWAGTPHIVEIPASTTDATFVDVLCDLVSGLGMYAHKYVNEAGNVCVEWEWTNFTDYVSIVGIVPVPTRPVRCLTVDSPRSIYLAGKSMYPTHNTAATSYLLGSQMRYENFGMIIVDPQGQWASEQGLPFSLQTFAEELGKEVLIFRISETLQLEKDTELFISLLKHTNLKTDLYMKQAETLDILWREMKKALKRFEKWEEEPSKELLLYLLGVLASDDSARRIYTTPDRMVQFQSDILELMNTPEQFASTLQEFAPIHNLFQKQNPHGEDRLPLRDVLRKCFEKSKKGSVEPAPLIILDMSTRSVASLNDDVDWEAEEALSLLDQDEVKAEILRSVFRSLKRTSEHTFRNNETLNALIVLDEAWRFAAPTRGVQGPVADLSTDLAGYARDTRKFGIGWFYISQSPYSINPDIWGQMSVRVFGTGLTGSDVDKMAEVLDRGDSVALYRTFGNPRATGIYPFLLVGPVSPLAANSSPLVVHTFTEFDDFRTENSTWLNAIRAKMGKPVLTGKPEKKQSAVRGKPVPQTVRKQILESSETVAQNKRDVGIENPDDYGADPFSDLFAGTEDPPF